MIFNDSELTAGHGLFKNLLVDPEDARSILRPQKDPIYGHGFTLNVYRGCSHGCKYCYVREYPAANLRAGQGSLHAPEAWGGWIAPKINAPELLWAQRHRIHGQAIFMSSATDPYQPIEREFRLTRRCLEVLLKCPTTRVLVHTRSPLVLQDLELIRSFGDRLSIGFSIPTDDDTVRQVVEPAAPPIPSRWAAVERLAQAGICVGMSAAPLMPIHDLKAFAQRAKDSGIRSAWVGGLRLIARDPFFRLLQDHDWLHILQPEYVNAVRSTLQEAFPRRQNPPRKAGFQSKAAIAGGPRAKDFQPALAF